MSVTFSGGGVTISGGGWTLVAGPPAAATAGWFAGGNGTNGPNSTVQRITFATDTDTATIRGPLSSANYSQGATGTFTYGWYAGGRDGPILFSTVTRITFATDSATSTNRGPLDREAYESGATTTDTYGWFGGGYSAQGGPTSSMVSRITYATDNATASSRGPLNIASGSLAASGDGTTYGWFGGGSNSPGVGRISTVQRITYTTDTNTASVRGPLTNSRTRLAATGTSTDGWYAGGLDLTVFPYQLSVVNRITYATDTATASTRGPLSTIRQGLTASSDNTYGWFGGGINPGASPIYVSTVDRITYATDTNTASTRGPLSISLFLLAATSGVQ